MRLAVQLMSLAAVAAGLGACQHHVVRFTEYPISVDYTKPLTAEEAGLTVTTTEPEGKHETRMNGGVANTQDVVLVPGEYFQDKSKKFAFAQHLRDANMPEFLAFAKQHRDQMVLMKGVCIRNPYYEKGLENGTVRLYPYIRDGNRLGYRYGSGCSALLMTVQHNE